MRTTLTLLFIFSILSMSLCEGHWGFKEEDDVVVLTTSTFDDFLSKHPFALVEFYAPWCGHCKKLAPEYSQAAAKLKAADPQVPLAKVDATAETDLGTRFEVQGYPTLKFFINGVAMEYGGGRTTDEIVQWVSKKTGPASNLVADAAALETLKKDNSVAVVYFGEENDDFKTFTTTASAYDGVAFGHVFSADLVAKHESKLVLFKQFDEGVNNFSGDFNQENMIKFIDSNRYPLVMEFEGDSAIERIFGKEATAIFLFAEQDGEHTEAFKAAAKAHTGKVVFSKSKVSSGLGQRLAEYVGVKADQAPCIRIVEPKSGDLVKFVYDGKIDVEGISGFLSDFENGKLARSYKSQEVPASNDEPVKVIVGKNFDELVKNSDKDVLLKFYAPWCGHCKTLAPKYDEVAKKLAYMNDKLMIAKVDATENEIPGVSIKGFPTIKFFKNGQKDAPIDFEGDRTEEGIQKWLKENVSFTWTDGASQETDL